MLLSLALSAGGPVASSVVGTRNSRCCLFGDTLNLESASKELRIQCSRQAGQPRTKTRVSSLPAETKIQAKGKKGTIKTCWLPNKDIDGGHIHDSVRRESYAMDGSILMEDIGRRASNGLVGNVSSRRSSGLAASVSFRRRSSAHFLFVVGRRRTKRSSQYLEEDESEAVLDEEAGVIASIP